MKKKEPNQSREKQATTELHASQWLDRLLTAGRNNLNQPISDEMRQELIRKISKYKISEQSVLVAIDTLNEYLKARASSPLGREDIEYIIKPLRIKKLPKVAKKPKSNYTEIVDLDDIGTFNDEALIPPKVLSDYKAENILPIFADASSPEEVGKILRAARKSAGLTQTDIANKMNTKVNAISRIENGGVSPTTDTISRYAETLGLTAKIVLES